MLQIILQCIGILFFMVLMPFGMGLLTLQTSKEQAKDFGMTIAAGYLTMFVTFEIVAVPIVLWVDGKSFGKLKTIYTIIALLLMATGYVLTFIQSKRGKKQFMTLKDSFPGPKAIWLAVLLVLIYILYMAVTHTSFDGDDSYYVVQSLIAQNTGGMYNVEPYTGGSTTIDVRHAMAVFTMWVAYMGSMTGIHSTVLCHSVLPCIIIPLVLITDSQIGKELFEDDKKKMLPTFILFMEMILLFGYVSLYTSETFLMTRTWQGKALASNFLFPIGILLMIKLSKNIHDKSVWLMLVMYSGAAGLFSSLAVMLSILLVVVWGFFIMIREKKFLLYVKLGLTCIPGVVYMGLYMMNYFLYAYIHYKK